MEEVEIVVVEAEYETVDLVDDEQADDAVVVTVEREDVDGGGDEGAGIDCYMIVVAVLATLLIFVQCLRNVVVVAVVEVADEMLVSLHLGCYY